MSKWPMLPLAAVMKIFCIVRLGPCVSAPIILTELSLYLYDPRSAFRLRALRDIDWLRFVLLGISEMRSRKIASSEFLFNTLKVVYDLYFVVANRIKEPALKD